MMRFVKSRAPLIEFLGLGKSPLCGGMLCLADGVMTVVMDCQ